MNLPDESERVVTPDGKLTLPWRRVLEASGGALAGYGPPSGAVSRNGFTTFTAPAAAGTYSQSQMQTVLDHVQVLSRLLGALVSDLRSDG